jgi:hypothetical protein
MTSPLKPLDPLERIITAARLLGVRNKAETVLDVSDGPLSLQFSKLSRLDEWLIEVDFGDATAVIVTCNWQGSGGYQAHGEYLFWLDTTQRIDLHSEIVPYVKRWLRTTLLRGIMRDDDILECPHLEISGQNA